MSITVRSGSNEDDPRAIDAVLDPSAHQSRRTFTAEYPAPGSWPSTRPAATGRAPPFCAAGALSVPDPQRAAARDALARGDQHRIGRIVHRRPASRTNPGLVACAESAAGTRVGQQSQAVDVRSLRKLVTS